MAVHHFTPCATQMDAFDRLRSIQFDPIAPIGGNHDLVLQARVPGYKIGDWETPAYKERRIYDGWDKQASLVPFEGWPLRRMFYAIRREQLRKIFEDDAPAVESILRDLQERGPLMPKDFEFQESRAELKSHWRSASVTKRVLRALWHVGDIMTAGRRKGQHLYDLTERVVPAHLYAQPMLDEDAAARELVLERHRAVGVLRPTAPPEVWSYVIYKAMPRRIATNELIELGELVLVDIEGAAAHATPGFLAHLDQEPQVPRVVFVAPLDQMLWDRKMIRHLFDFDYVWEIYVPEAKRKWGYYVLPVLYGDRFVGRAEFWSRKGTLEVRGWHFEEVSLEAAFWPALELALRDLMAYSSSTSIVANGAIDERVRSVVDSLR